MVITAGRAVSAWHSRDRPKIVRVAWRGSIGLQGLMMQDVSGLLIMESARGGGLVDAWEPRWVLGREYPSHKQSFGSTGGKMSTR